MHTRQRILFRIALLASTLALASIASSATAQTYDFRVVHSFTGPPDDGQYPYGRLQFDAAGSLYGATTSGGAADSGTIFKIAKDGTETIIHSFDGEAGGRGPMSGVAIDRVTGDLYGTTYYGGDLDACPDDHDPTYSGCGVIFKLGADGTFTVLHRFVPSETLENLSPIGDLLVDSRGTGTVYGTTVGYWVPDRLGSTGTIYRYSVDGGYTVLHRFAPGTYPAGGLIRDKDGNFYGVSRDDSGNTGGAIYKLASTGAFTTLYTFIGYSNGSSPLGRLVGDKAGNLYGVTYSGGSGSYGTAYKLAPDGSLTTLHNFSSSTSVRPYSSLVMIGGNLYGTTRGEYTSDDVSCGDKPQYVCPSVFKLSLDGTMTILHEFAYDPPEFLPGGPLTAKNGRLFGTGYAPGSQGNIIYSIRVTNP